MKKFLFLFIIFISIKLSGQIRILTDVSTGCLPLAVNFSVIPDTTVNWDFDNGDISTLSKPGYIFKDSGTYNVVCTINGSSDPDDTDTAVINVFDCPDREYSPNVFSPNNDGENDFFEVRTNSSFTYLFSVYSRSGTLVYQTKSPTIVWDGRSMSGQEMTSGIYFYTIIRLNSEFLKEFPGIVYLYK